MISAKERRIVTTVDSMSTGTDSPQMDVYSGVRWSALAAWGQQAVQFGISIVLARLLMPQDYGLLAMATVFVGFLGIFKTMGFGTVVIQRRQLSDNLLSSLFWLICAIAGLLAVAAAVAGPLAARIYQEPRVMPVMAVLGVTFLLSAPGMIPEVLLIRQMRFGRVAIVELTSALAGGTVGIVLAVAGSGVWALVVAALSSTTISAALFYAFCGWRPRLTFHFWEVRTVFRFGANLTGFGMFNYFTRNADNLIIGVFLGAGPLGYYALAYNILLKPRHAVTGVLMRVVFPTFSRMQDDDERLKAAYLRACGAIAFVTFPMMFGLLAVASPFVQVVLGEKWLPAVPLICILAPLGALQSVWAPVGSLFIAKDRTDWYLRMGVAQGCVTVCSFLAGVPWGAIGVAVAYALANLFWIPVWLWLAGRLVTGLRVRDFASGLLPYGLLSLVMCPGVLLCEHVLTATGMSRPVTLAVSIAAGICIYVGAALVIQPVALTDFGRMLPKSWTTKLLRRGTGTLDTTATH